MRGKDVSYLILPFKHAAKYIEQWQSDLVLTLSMNKVR